MPGSVGVLGPECRSKGIDILESHGIGLAVKLAAYRKVGGLVEEVLAEVHPALWVFGNIVEV